MYKKAIWVLLVLSVVIVGCSLNRSAHDERKLTNYRAFAKLYGYIKYFHPSDEASKIDWDKFAVYGMKKVESASNDAELKNTLNELFKPIAPLLELHENEKYAYDKTHIIPYDTSNMKIVAWQHKGVSLADKLSPYQSIRTDRSGRTESKFGTIGQTINAGQFAGKKIKLTGAIKTSVEGAGNQAQMWIRVDRKNSDKPGFVDNMSDRPIVSGAWKEYEITGNIDTDAVSISFGCLLTGMGKAWVDEMRLYYMETNGSWREIEIRNTDFESGEEGALPVPWGERQDNYNIALTSAEKFKGKMSVMIEFTGPDRLMGRIFDKTPIPGETSTKKLSDNLYCTFPLALYSDSKGTFPKADAKLYRELTAGMDKDVPSPLDANSPYVRLADIAIAWNVWEHFYPYFDAVQIDWEPKLKEYLDKAIEAKDETEFFQVVKEMTAELKDGQAAVVWEKDKKYSFAPVLLDYIENKVVVTRVLDESVKDISPGDVITNIDGVSVDTLIKDISKFISSATPQWKLYKITHYELTKGAAGSDIRLSATDITGKTKNVVLKRSYDADQIDVKGWDDENRPNEIQEISKDIYYADLTRAGMDSINRSINELANAKGVIFDLRGYPNSNDEIIRHLIDGPVQSPKWNIPRTIYPDRENLAGYDTLGRWWLTPVTPRLKGKIIFLTNDRAISYAESILGIIEAYKLAEIVGEPTAGTNGDVNTLNLPGAYVVYWTGMKVLKHDGSQHQGIGIQPTVTVYRTIKGVSEGRDEFMEKALEIINQK